MSRLFLDCNISFFKKVLLDLYVYSSLWEYMLISLQSFEKQETQSSFEDVPLHKLCPLALKSHACTQVQANYEGAAGDIL